MTKTMMWIGCVSVALLSSELVAADWPCWRGPNGNGSSDYDGPMIDKPEEARQIWKSEDWVEPPLTGGYSSPVVADGRVYVYFYTGDGKVIDEEGLKKRANKRKNLSADRLRALASPASDEIVLCVDLKTGKRLWKYVSPSTGLNYQRCNTAGHYTPCVGEGKVTVIGISGTLFCVDAKSGELVWKKELPQYASSRRHRDECVAKKRVSRGWGGKGTGNPWCAPVITEGLTVVDLHNVRDKKQPENSVPGGTFAYDLASGEQRWHAKASSRCKSPLVWRHEGKDYVIADNSCIDPTDGKILWTLKGAAHSSGTPGLWKDYIVYSGGGSAGANAWKISPKGGTKVWQLTGEHVSVSGCNNSLAIHRGVVYLGCGNVRQGKHIGRVRVVDVATGEELAVSERMWGHGLSSSPVAIGNRLLLMKNGFQLFSLGKGYKALGTTKEIPMANVPTPALVDGLMIFRGRDALYCYDVRKDLGNRAEVSQ